MNTKTEITPQEMVLWFRSKAAEFNKIADSVEATFTGKGGILTIPDFSKEVTLDEIKKAIGSNRMRAADIAQNLNTSRDRVLAIVEANKEAFERIGKGWIAVK